MVVENQRIINDGSTDSGDTISVGNGITVTLSKESGNSHTRWDFSGTVNSLGPWIIDNQIVATNGSGVFWGTSSDDQA